MINIILISINYSKYSFMRYFLSFLLIFSFYLSQAQKTDQEIIKAIFDEALKNGDSYEMLEELTKRVGARLSGTPEAAAAVIWSQQQMKRHQFDKVFLQEVMVPHWVRGNVEVVKVVNSGVAGTINLKTTTLGNSVGTPKGGLVAGVVEVRDFDELKEMGKAGIEGKIVFFNRPFDPTLIQTFSAYSGAVNQRGSGASEAARYGAVAVLVRSMASNVDDHPHTGSLRYDEDQPKIPAMAISTRDAELLSSLVKREKEVKVFMENHAFNGEEVLSHNVIGELKGKKENSYIVVGGHLDSWDIGEGAHDDGSGCVQSIEALRILKSIGYQPNHTLRAVMFMNEENGLRGGRKYAEEAANKSEKHVAAIESDRGGFVPRGFTLSMKDKQKEKVQSWQDLLEPYGLYNFSREGGGADIGPLGRQGVPLLGLLPDSQRYFNVHHSSADVFEAVDKRELELGAAAMAAMIYLIDTYGL